jgi:TRAP-type mannitol/chloroaromatic compound transport system permease large subunit
MLNIFYLLCNSISVVPLVILMSAFTFYAGITTELFYTASKWLGRLPGGLALATIAGRFHSRNYPVNFVYDGYFRYVST